MSNHPIIERRLWPCQFGYLLAFSAEPPTYSVEAIPLHLREASEYVARHHRHNKPTVGGMFALGAAQDGKLVGVAIAGRPVALCLDDGKTLEILRVTTDGTANTCSSLYARCAKIARLTGYKRIITYTLEEEPELRCAATGYQAVGLVTGGSGGGTHGSPA